MWRPPPTRNPTPSHVNPSRPGFRGFLMWGMTGLNRPGFDAHSGVPPVWRFLFRGFLMLA